MSWFVVCKWISKKICNCKNERVVNGRTYEAQQEYAHRLEEGEVSSKEQRRFIENYLRAQPQRAWALFSLQNENSVQRIYYSQVICVYPLVCTIFWFVLKMKDASTIYKKNKLILHFQTVWKSLDMKGRFVHVLACPNHSQMLSSHVFDLSNISTLAS
jgi:hypothetical protein